MDVLFVVEEDGNVWEIGFVASAEEVWASIEGKMRQDLLCACEVYLKVGGYVVADEGLGVRQEVDRGMTRKEALTVISSAADRDTGFVRWSRYLTFTFWDGDRSLL